MLSSTGNGVDADNNRNLVGSPYPSGLEAVQTLASGDINFNNSQRVGTNNTFQRTTNVVS